jgi:hypothetical protein
MVKEKINLKQMACSTNPNKDNKQRYQAKESIDDFICMLSTKTTKSAGIEELNEMIAQGWSLQEKRYRPTSLSWVKVHTLNMKNNAKPASEKMLCYGNLITYKNLSTNDR